MYIFYWQQKTTKITFEADDRSQRVIGTTVLEVCKVSQ